VIGVLSDKEAALAYFLSLDTVGRIAFINRVYVAYLEADLDYERREQRLAELLSHALAGTEYPNFGYDGNNVETALTGVESKSTALPWKLFREAILAVWRKESAEKEKSGTYAKR